jgi:hypothetical protein
VVALASSRQFEIGVFKLLPVSYLGIGQHLDMDVSCKDDR